MSKRPYASAAPSGKKAHHCIRSLELTGGFLKGARFEFKDGLNCVIGGRGTGKTTVIEFMRYVLGLMPDARTSPTRSRAQCALVQGNLANGRVQLEIETKHGVIYNAERSWSEQPRVSDEGDEPLGVSLDRDLTFRADIYSQNEIEEIATNPSFQLVLIDKFVDEDVRRLNSQIAKLERALDQNAAELVQLDREIAALAESAAEVKGLELKLKELRTSGPDADRVNDAHAYKGLRAKERKTLELVVSDVRRVKADFDSLAAASFRRLCSRIDQDVSEGPNRDAFASITTEVAQLSALIERAAGMIEKGCDHADAALAGQERLLARRHAKQEGEYQALVERSSEENGRVAERAKLQQQHLEATTARKDLEPRKRERRAREQERKQIAAKVTGLRDERFALRHGIAEHLTEALSPTIRVSIVQHGSRRLYEFLLTEGLKGSGMKYVSVIDKITKAMFPEEFAEYVRRGQCARLAERTGLDEDRARRVVDAFAGTELLFRIESVELEDLPRIELLDGDYKDAGNLSTGQRCTTILPILLLESDRPLLIDQPEDNLDNKFIYETVVRRVQGAKGSRQLIFVTHNPNIPVLGDAERVFVLSSDGRHARIENEGTVDELKGQIETLLEGGKEAFLMRKQRYGH